MKKILSALGLGSGIILVILFILFMFVVGPLLFVYGLNLIGFETAYTFETLFGAFLIMIVLRGGGTSSK